VVDEEEPEVDAREERVEFQKREEAELV